MMKVYRRTEDQIIELKGGLHKYSLTTCPRKDEYIFVPENAQEHEFVRKFVKKVLKKKEAQS